MSHPQPLSQWMETVSTAIENLSRPQASTLAYWSYGIGIECASNAVPPASDALYGKLRGLMIDTHIDKPLVLHQIIDALGNRFPVWSSYIYPLFY